MPRKTLIINGSPRLDGNTAQLIAAMKETLEGEILEISAFRASIHPCVDCRSCWKTARCVVRDDMDLLYDDSYDNVVLASPVYFATLPGQVLNLMSRFQPWHAATYFLQEPWVQKPKKAALILTAGGKGNEAGAEHHIRALFKLLGAKGYEEHRVMSLQTDTIPVQQDPAALAGARELGLWLNKPLEQ